MSALFWFDVIWPAEVSEAEGVQLLQALRGMPGAVVELVATEGSLRHRLAVPDTYRSLAVRSLRTALPQLVIEPTQRDLPDEGACWRWRRPDDFPLATDRVDSIVRNIYAVLGALLAGSEELVLQWVLGPTLPPNTITTGETLGGGAGSVLLAPLVPPRNLAASELRLMQAKQSLPGWRVTGRLAIYAPRQRQQYLLRQVVAAVRVAQAPGSRLELRRTTRASAVRASMGVLSSGSANVVELLALAAIPVGEQTSGQLRRQRHRLLRRPSNWPTTGLVLGNSLDGKPITLPPEKALLHTALTGPTGTGKSVAMQRMITQALESGAGLVCIDPKQDLIEAVLSHLPAKRQNDVVYLDPLDSEAVVGINPLAGAVPELAADSALNIFRQLYGDLIGPRSGDLLHAGLLLLARAGGQTLVSLPVLLMNDEFRRDLMRRTSADPILSSVLQWYDGLSGPEQATVRAPLMNKVRPLLYREGLRRVIGQPVPRFDISDVLRQRKVLLVSLARGRLGPEGANLLGALVMNQLWRAIEQRVTVPPERRQTVYVVLDEFADFMALPVDLGEALAKSRGLGAAFVLAHQHFSQLKPALRSSMANVRNRIAFTSPIEDGRVLAAASTGLLKPDDFVRLPQYEAYVRLADLGWASLRTLPPEQPSSDPAAIRALSRQRYGFPVEEIDRQITELLTGGPDREPPTLGRRRKP